MPPADEYDYIIVGAGSAGCALAGRLSEDPALRILLIEAGPPNRRKEIHIPAAFPHLLRSECDWNYVTTPQAALGGRTVYLPRGKTLGGCSSINAMVFQRGHRLDFEAWAARGNVGWGWDDVLPYFKRLENWSGASGPLRGRGGPVDVTPLRDPNPLTRAFLDAAEANGIQRTDDYNGEHMDGVSLAQVTQRRGRRWSTADAYLTPGRGRRNLAVMTDTPTSRIVLEKQRAVGVIAGRPARTLHAAREVILAAGTYNSPQLLMLSGIGPADHLRRHGIDVALDLAGVGRNLKDHPLVLLKYACTRPLTLAAATSVGNLLRYLLLRKGLLTSNVCEGVGFLRSAAAPPAPDLEIVFAPVLFDTDQLPTAHAFTVGAVCLTPRSSGDIELASSDPAQAPLIHPNFYADDRDLRVMVEGVKLARQIAADTALAPYRGDELIAVAHADTDAAIEEVVRNRSETIYHPVGTCRMGTDAMAVVDPQLRVRGIQGLRVVDASVMPEIVRAHTNATTIMIAERAADLIKTAPWT